MLETVPSSQDYNVQWQMNESKGVIVLNLPYKVQYTWVMLQLTSLYMQRMCKYIM